MLLTKNVQKISFLWCFSNLFLKKKKSVFKCMHLDFSLWSKCIIEVSVFLQPVVLLMQADFVDLTCAKKEKYFENIYLLRKRGGIDPVSGIKCIPIFFIIASFINVCIYVFALKKSTMGGLEFFFLFLSVHEGQK